MVHEVVEWLDLEPNDLIVDMTFGGGGYSRAVLDKLGEGGRLVAFDRDKDAVDRAELRFADETRLSLHHAAFSEAPDYVRLHNSEGFDGIMFDLGVSSHQIDTDQRGFSFQADGPLDMRMNANGDDPSAADLVNGASVAELSKIFFEYGEEKKARAVARRIEKRRAERRFDSTADLADVIASVVGRPGRSKRGPVKHPATRCFQALRIAVNDELGELERGLQGCLGMAKPGARIVVVSYHSLEDRFVKNFFRDAAGRCHCPRHQPVCTCDVKTEVVIKTKRPLRPSQEEVERNRRSRSALLRVAEKI